MTHPITPDVHILNINVSLCVECIYWYIKYALKLQWLF